MTCHRAVSVTRRVHLILLIGVIALLATACGSTAGSNSTSSGGTKKVTSIAMLLPGKKTDIGYSGSGAKGLAAAAQQYGITKTAIAEQVDVSQQVTAYRTFASQGFSLVVGWGGQYETGAIEVAKDFPKVYFLDVSGDKGNGSNYSGMDWNNNQITFLLGFVAGKTTKTNVVSNINGPCSSSSAQNTYGFIDGAKYANPGIKVLTTGLNSYDDPVGAKEAALAQIAQGSDVIYTNLNTGNQGSEAAAEQKGVLVETDYSDPYNGPAFLTDAARPQETFIAQAVKAVNSGTFSGQPLKVGLGADYSLLPAGGKVSDSVRTAALDLQKKIAAGQIQVATTDTCPLP